MNRRHIAWLAAFGGVSLLPSCAWSNPDNRPIWNAFEHNLVPDDGGWFYAALPVTVPLGFVSVLIDTFLAHPVQVVDDAFDDAGELWVENDPDFVDAYYTEMAWLPFRVTLTPLVFAGSFTGRSLFDIRERETLTDEQRAERQRQVELQRQLELRSTFLAWLDEVVRDPDARSGQDRPDWHESFAEPLRQALASDALVRLAVHDQLLGDRHIVFGVYRAEDGLRDPDPVVRFGVLQRWPTTEPIPVALLASLRDDPDEAVRLLARRR